jgi:hypothetical protein
MAAPSKRSYSLKEKQDRRDFFAVDMPGNEGVDRDLIMKMGWDEFKITRADLKEDLKGVKMTRPYDEWTKKEQLLFEVEAIAPMSEGVEKNTTNLLTTVVSEDVPIIVPKNHNHTNIYDFTPQFIIPEQIGVTGDDDEDDDDDETYNDGDEEYFEKLNEDDDERNVYTHSMLSNRAKFTLLTIRSYIEFENWISVKMCERDKHRFIRFDQVNDLLIAIQSAKGPVKFRNNYKLVQFVNEPPKSRYIRIVWNIDDEKDAFYIMILIKLDVSKKLIKRIHKDRLELISPVLANIDISQISTLPCYLIMYKYFVCPCISSY